MKDKRTGVPIADLKPENFEVYDDGKPRPISYFTRKGQARKPLALVLVLDLRDDGAGRFLKRPEVLKAMADELAKLPPEDEVAIVTINVNQIDGEAIIDRTGHALWLTGFTRDRAQLAAALARVPTFIEASAVASEKAAKEKQKNDSQQSKGSLSITSDSAPKSRKTPPRKNQRPMRNQRPPTSSRPKRSRARTAQ